MLLIKLDGWKQWVGSTYMVGGYWVLGSTHMVLVEMRGRFVRSGIAEPGSTRDITACNLAPKGDKRNTKQMIWLELWDIYHQHPRWIPNFSLLHFWSKWKLPNWVQHSLTSGNKVNHISRQKGKDIAETYQKEGQEQLAEGCLWLIFCSSYFTAF